MLLSHPLGPSCSLKLSRGSTDPFRFFPWFTPPRRQTHFSSFAARQVCVAFAWGFGFYVEVLSALRRQDRKRQHILQGMRYKTITALFLPLTPTNNFHQSPLTKRVWVNVFTIRPGSGCTITAHLKWGDGSYDTNPISRNTHNRGNGSPIGCYEHSEQYPVV